MSLRSRIRGGRGGGGVATRSGPEWDRRGGPARLVTVSAQSCRSSGSGAGQERGAATPMLRGRDQSLRQNGLGARAFSQARREPVIAARRRGEASGRARARTAACVEWRPSGAFRELPWFPGPAQLGEDTGAPPCLLRSPPGNSSCSGFNVPPSGPG